MAEPTVSEPTFWGATRDPEALPWPEAERRLRDAPVYWLTSTTGSGRPIPRPVWGVWLDQRLLLTVGSVSHWHNIVDRGRHDVAVNLPSDEEVVIVDGAAHSVTDPAELSPMIGLYNDKYRWNFTPTTTGPVIAIEPRKVIAWTTRPAAEGTPDMDFPDAASRFTFGD